MIKRAQEIFAKEAMKLLFTKDKDQFDISLGKFSQLADILDQAGDENSADKIDDILKQASFWSALLSGMAGGGGESLWDALKTGKFKESLINIVKKALIGGTTAVAVEYMIKWLDGVPVIGSILRELQGADKLRSILEGVVANAVSNSNLANTLVDEALLAIEKMLGFSVPIQQKKQQQQEAPNPSQQIPAKEEASDTKNFQMSQPEKKAMLKSANEAQECTKCWNKMENKGTPIFKEFADQCSSCLNKRFYALRYLAGYAGGHLENNIRKEFDKLESVAPAHVTGESHNFGDRGQRDRKNGVDILSNRKMMTFLTPEEVKLTLEYNQKLGE